MGWARLILCGAALAVITSFSPTDGKFDINDLYMSVFLFVNEAK